MSTVEIELDGKKVQVPQGSMVMHAAEKAGVYIPHFCYHKKLSIAANCRMCLVDVEKAPKAMPACATPVTQDMVVRTKSDKAIKAQQSVMEFLLINHPLDCPICDQGGECQLQDLAVGYGRGESRYEEEKHVTMPKDVGPLISMEEMSRCIHCTRCVRFGQEIAGQMELGMSNRGEHSEIETFLGESVDSELSGNMIDVCPVGALTSKPFRYNARTWELSRRKSISPHDSTGANLVVQVKNHRVMRVVPFENEAINECWLADRDRFSYEALNSEERLTQPMLKQGGEWKEVEWATALEYVANGMRQIQQEHGAQALGALVSPHATTEELYLAAQLVRGLGSDNIDHRIRHAEFGQSEGVRYLGMPIQALSQLNHVLVVGSRLRKDHPLFAARIRQITRRGGHVDVIGSAREFKGQSDWAMPVRHHLSGPAAQWAELLGQVASAVAQIKGVAAPVVVEAGEAARAVAKSLIDGEQTAVLLGNAAAHHANASSLLALAQWISIQTGAKFGYLTEAANTVGAQVAGAQPRAQGLNAEQMINGGTKALMLLNVELGLDAGHHVVLADRLAGCEMIVSLSHFKDGNMAYADVMLPIAPFTETSGTFINAEGLAQSFHAVVKPLGETRPAWKVLRVLGNLLGIQSMSHDSSQDVLAAAGVTAGSLVNGLSNATQAPIKIETLDHVPCVAGIYQLDGIVRRAPALQRTVDALQEVSA